MTMVTEFGAGFAFRLGIVALNLLGKAVCILCVESEIGAWASSPLPSLEAIRIVDTHDRRHVMTYIIDGI